MLNLTPLPAFNDNYIWLLQNPESKGCAVVDPGDARPVLQWLQDNADWQLSDILVTHHHSDHTGGIEQIKQATGARVIAPASEDISHSDLSAVDGQSVRVLGHELQVMHVPGHTLGHVAYYHAGEPGFVLSGDTLFAAGCGRMFEGTPEQMAASLLRLAQLPPATLVYCAHEYTRSNLEFAAAVEPDNQHIRQRLQQVIRLREHNGISLPSNMGLELQTNPFLRLHLPQVRQQLQQHGLQPEQDHAAAFAVMRKWKDNF